MKKLTWVLSIACTNLGRGIGSLELDNWSKASHDNACCASICMQGLLPRVCKICNLSVARLVNPHSPLLDLMCLAPSMSRWAEPVWSAMAVCFHAFLPVLFTWRCYTTWKLIPSSMHWSGLSVGVVIRRRYGQTMAPILLEQRLNSPGVFVNWIAPKWSLQSDALELTGTSIAHMPRTRVVFGNGWSGQSGMMMPWWHCSLKLNVLWMVDP